MATFKTEINVKNDADGYDILLPKTTYDMVRTDDGSKLSDVRINGQELKGEITIETTTEAPPINHASNTTQYGAGTSSQYGHVKLSDNYTSNSGGAGNSLGASQTALYNAYNSLNSKIADLSTGKFLPITGGTLTGDLRIKSGSNYGTKLNLGDGDYVHLYERTDDNLDIKAKTIDLLCTNLYQNGKPIGGGAGSKKNVTKYTQDIGRFTIPDNTFRKRLDFSGNILNGQSYKLSFAIDFKNNGDIDWVNTFRFNLGMTTFRLYNNFQTNKHINGYIQYISLKDMAEQLNTSSGVIGIFIAGTDIGETTALDGVGAPAVSLVFENSINDVTLSSGVTLDFGYSTNKINSPEMRFMHLTSYRYY